MLMQRIPQVFTIYYIMYFWQLQFLAVQLVQLPASSSAETVTAIQSHVIPESHGLQSVSATFYDVISLLKCSKMCMVRSFSSCKSYSYNQGARLCKISNDVTSQSTAIAGDHTHSIRGLLSNEIFIANQQDCWIQYYYFNFHYSIILKQSASLH